MSYLQEPTPGVYLEELPSLPTIAPASTSVTAFVGGAASGPVDCPESLASDADFERVFGEPSQEFPLGLAVRDFFRNGGTDAVAVRASGARGGIAALDDDASQVDLLVLVPDAPDRSPSLDLVAAAAAFCERRGAMLLLDAPACWSTVDDVVRAAAAGFESTLGTSSRNAVAFFPRVQAAESGGERLETVAASVAGIYARTDTQHGVWKAPAGIEATLAGAPQLAVALTDADHGRLGSVGVNGLRDLPGTGTVLWGARTLAGRDGGEPEWRYVTVRRTALFVEKSLVQGTSWAVFESNGPRLWESVRRGSEQFLRGLWQEGAFAGGAMQEAFFVRCDATTTTQRDLDRGLLNLQVGFAPVRPAEFLVLTITLHVGGATDPSRDEEPS